jgi:GTP pyrophosphokinase
MSEEKERLVDVEWDVGKDDEFLVRIEMIVDDRKNMLRDILEAIAAEDVNIRDAEMKAQEGTAHGRLVFEVRNLKQLQRVLDKIKRTKGVISVWRSQGGEE